MGVGPYIQCFLEEDTTMNWQGTTMLTYKHNNWLETEITNIALSFIQISIYINTPKNPNKPTFYQIKPYNNAIQI